MTSAPLLPAQTARWNTLQLLKAARALLPALAALLLCVILVATGIHRGAMQTVGKDAAPSIIHAQHIRAALADMDANAANELLAPGNTGGAAATGYEKRRIEATEEMVLAARNITYDAEQEPVDRLEVSLGTYERLIEQSLDFASDGQTARSARAYHTGGDVMDGVLLSAADDLDKANDVVLESTYESESKRSFWARLLVLLAGLLAVAGLALTQVFLARRTHRTLNPLLLLATVVTVALVIDASARLGEEEHHLKVAKEDAFTSVHALWRARSVGYAANSDESRVLLDPATAAADQDMFFSKANAIVHLPPSTPFATVLARAARGDSTPGFTGFLADELNNTTFRGEREAAVRALAAWERYLNIDAEIRQAAAAGDRRRAIDLCIGEAEGQSNWAFDQFDHALGEALDINQQAFDVSVAGGFRALQGLEWKASIAVVLIAILSFLGLAPRIREYV